MKRRRFITILAGTAAAAGLASWQRKRGVRTWRWQGVLFNADVNLSLQGVRAEEAERLNAACVSEMQRLERLFSLYLPESTLCELNREGEVSAPPPEFTELVARALEVAERSGGAFDPTVQPYWTWLRDRSGEARDQEEDERRRHLELVDYRKVILSDGGVRFARPGMGMTLNGVAQGYITDRVCALLRNHGMEHCLVNLGEFVAIGAQASGDDWAVGIRGTADAVTLRDQALAVSSGSGHYFGTGNLNHLIDPKTGNCANHRRTVAVTAPEAVLADALSTAASVLDDTAAQAMVRTWEGARLWIHRSATT